MLGAIGARVLDRELPVGQAATRVAAGGGFADDEVLAQLDGVVAELVAAVEARRELAAAA